jgi:hypothetical protein
VPIAPKIDFDYKTLPKTLESGGYFSLPREHGFRDTASSDLRSLIAEIETGRPWRETVASRYQSSRPWLYRIITEGSRTAFFNQVLPAGSGPVLDIGSGWGQIARPLAQHRPVAALEPVAERMAFIRAAAKQDGVSSHMAFLEADYFDLHFRTRFAAICAIGVLEWVGAFQDHADPQKRQQDFLLKAHSELAPGGSLILGIENRVGLKYLLGCPDDHIGVPNIACLPAALARRRWREARSEALQSFTYSYPELEQMLRAAGFRKIEFFGAFPDYKLPEIIIPFGEAGGTLNDRLKASPMPPEHNGYDGSALDPQFQETLQAHYRDFAAQGIAHFFVPSFFVAAQP